jgi:hypothetical protein
VQVVGFGDCLLDIPTRKLWLGDPPSSAGATVAPVPRRRALGLALRKRLVLAAEAPIGPPKGVRNLFSQSLHDVCRHDIV